MNPTQARQLLGVHGDASEEQIRRAFRRKAREAHPDAGGDPQAFVRLQEAVTVLTTAVRQAPPTRSPSTGSHRVPSTDGPLAAGWGETTQQRWHDGPVSIGSVDWDAPLPSGVFRWNRDLLARSLAGPGVTPVGQARGLSRKPASFMNRTAAWLSDDLFSSWTICASRSRGNAGHDVEVALQFPPGPGRKFADRADFPLGWVVERRPNRTHVVRILHPSHQIRATAVRAAASLDDLLRHIGWPLTDWQHVPGEVT